MEQGSQEWLDARKGILTASRFKDVLAARHTAAHKNYVTEVANAIIGVPDFDEGDNKPWFRHGNEWEDEACGSYEFETGLVVDHDGLIIHPEFPHVGCSPDGLVGTDGGVEIKSRKSREAYLKSVEAGVDSIHIPQIQGCMWVTGRQWWDYVSYFKAPKTGDYDMHIFRVHRDEAYITRLSHACRATWVEIQQQVENYHAGY